MDEGRIAEEVVRYQNAQKMNERQFQRSTRRLRDSLVPPYENLFTEISRLPGGLALLVQMRQDVLAATKGKNLNQKSKLYAIDESLKERFTHWFSMTSLRLERITRQSPALVLEKIIKYEAVHSIPSW